MTLMLCILRSEPLRVVDWRCSRSSGHFFAMNYMFYTGPSHGQRGTVKENRREGGRGRGQGGGGEWVGGERQWGGDKERSERGIRC